MFGGAIKWMSKQQEVIALSTSEVEYMETNHESNMVAKVVFKNWV
jgi:hypothetical protein